MDSVTISMMIDASKRILYLRSSVPYRSSNAHYSSSKPAAFGRSQVTNVQSIAFAESCFPPKLFCDLWRRMRQIVPLIKPIVPSPPHQIEQERPLSSDQTTEKPTKRRIKRACTGTLLKLVCESPRVKNRANRKGMEKRHVVVTAAVVVAAAHKKCSKRGEKITTEGMKASETPLV